MKVSHPMLLNFIEDFKFQAAGTDLICFDADVVFLAQGRSKTVRTEIQIVTIAHSGLTMLYLLNPDVISSKIPETIFFENGKFMYLERSALLYLDQNDEYGKYTISIMPLNRQCSDEVLNGLKKMHDN